MSFAPSGNRIKTSLSLPRTVHVAARQEAIRLDLTLSDLLVRILAGQMATPPRHRARLKANGAGPVRPSVALPSSILGAAVQLAAAQETSPTVVMSRVVVDYFTR